MNTKVTFLPARRTLRRGGRRMGLRRGGVWCYLYVCPGDNINKRCPGTFRRKRTREVFKLFPAPGDRMFWVNSVDHMHSIALR